HTRSKRDWSSDVCSSDLGPGVKPVRLSDVLLVLVLAGILTGDCGQKSCNLRVVGVDARLGDVTKRSQGLVALLALDTLFLTTTVALVVTLDNRVEIAVAYWVTVLIDFSAELLDGGGRVDLHQTCRGLDETLAGGRVAEGSSFTVIVDQSTQRANLN